MRGCDEKVVRKKRTQGRLKRKSQGKAHAAKMVQGKELGRRRKMGGENRARFRVSHAWVMPALRSLVIGQNGEGEA